LLLSLLGGGDLGVEACAECEFGDAVME